MSKIKPFWRVVLGFLILGFVVSSSNRMIVQEGSFFAFAFWGAFLAAYIFLAIKIPYDDPLRSMRDLMAQQQAEQKPEPDPAPEQPARTEWADTHGRLVTNIAGVTFDNDDGSSRQKLLRDLMVSGGEAELTLEEFEYKGHPAVRVLVDGDCIGNIPAKRVDDVLAAMDAGITASHLDVETFRPDDDDEDRPAVIYRADLTLIYNK